MPEIPNFNFSHVFSAIYLNTNIITEILADAPLSDGSISSFSIRHLENNPIEATDKDAFVGL